LVLKEYNYIWNENSLLWSSTILIKIYFKRKFKVIRLILIQASCLIIIYLIVHIFNKVELFLLLAELAGFNNPIPPFAGASQAQANIGLNYASGAGGIREETSENMVTTLR